MGQSKSKPVCCVNGVNEKSENAKGENAKSKNTKGVNVKSENAKGECVGYIVDNPKIISKSYEVHASNFMMIFKNESKIIWYVPGVDRDTSCELVKTHYHYFVDVLSEIDKSKNKNTSVKQEANRYHIIFESMKNLASTELPLDAMWDFDEVRVDEVSIDEASVDKNSDDEVRVDKAETSQLHQDIISSQELQIKRLTSRNKRLMREKETLIEENENLKKEKRDYSDRVLMGYN